MRYTRTKNLLIREKVARNLYGDKERLLIGNGSVLNSNSIERLSQYGFRGIFIDDGLPSSKDDDLNLYEDEQHKVRIEESLNQIFL